MSIQKLMKDIKVNPHPNKIKYIYTYVWKSIFILLCKLKTNQSILNPLDFRWIGVALLVQLYWGILIAQ